MTHRESIKRSIYLLVSGFITVIVIIVLVVLLRSNARKNRYNEAKDILIEMQKDIKELKDCPCQCQNEKK
jgi:predicted membrane chloride channel (bestrophin family)